MLIMPLEIERKFLIKNNSWENHVSQQVSIKQGYLSTDPERTVRIRISNDNAFITIKGKSKGATRSEFEYAIPIHDAQELLKLCIPNIIEKVRYLIKHGDHTWELDVFKGKHHGLVIAEIELNSENEKFDLPIWVGEEVTGDVRFYNSYLSNLKA